MKTSIQVVAGFAVVAVLSGASIFFGYELGTVRATAKIRTESRVVSERDQKILAYIVKRNPSATIREFADFPAFLVEQAQQRGLDYRYVMAIIDKESEWNPRAVSSAGAIGLMQIMPATGVLVSKNAGLGAFDPPGGGGPNRTALGTLGDPRLNVVIGMTHLRSLMDQYGLGPEHLRAYNRGDVSARAHWPADRYAEEVALRFVQLSMRPPTDRLRPEAGLPLPPAVQEAKQPQAAENAVLGPPSPASRGGQAIALMLSALVVRDRDRALPSLETATFEPRDAAGVLLPRRVASRP